MENQQLPHPYLFVGMRHEKPTMERVEDVICSYFDIPSTDIHSKNRTTKVRKTRQIIAWVLNEKFNYKKLHIANYLAMDHTSIMHSVNVVANDIRLNEEYKAQIDELLFKLKFI